MVGEVIVGILGSAIGAVVAVVLYCELAAWALDGFQQRRLDGWHRRRWVRRWRARAGLRPDDAGRGPTARVVDVASHASAIRWARWRKPWVVLALAVVFWPALLWLVWRWWRGSRAADAPAAPPEVRPRRPGRSTPRSRWLRFVSGLLFGLALLMFLTMSPPPSEFEGPYAQPNFAGVFLASGVVVLSALAYRGSRRASLLPASETMAADRRPAVLYLRSFGDDRLRMRAHRSKRHAVVDRISPVRRDPIEEIVAEKLWSYGPVLTVSQPGDERAPLGAAREQLRHDDWRRTVEQRMRDAALVVVMLGRTAGLAWEIEALARLGMWHKVLVLFPPVRAAELERRWAATQPLLSAHGGPRSGPDADLRAILVVTSPTGRDVLSYVADRRDDWSYEAALRAAVADLALFTHEPASPG